MRISGAAMAPQCQVSYSSSGTVQF